MMSQFSRVSLKYSVFQVTRPEVDTDVKQVQKIRKVVQAKPDNQCLAIYFL